jgi:hypothetical protein
MGSDESRVIGGAIEEAWKHPKAAWDLSTEAVKVIDENEPLARHYVGGRMAIWASRIGAGRTLWRHSNVGQ